MTCIVYPKKYGTEWSGERVACKYFREKEESGQIDITDLIKMTMDEK